MIARTFIDFILALVLFVQAGYAAAITDSFLHQGNKTDYLVFYTDEPVQTRLMALEQKDGNDRVVVYLKKARAVRPQLLSRLNKKVTTGYQFLCTKSGHDVMCTFVYPQDAFMFSLAQQKNWHGGHTIVISGKRAIEPEEPTESKPVIVVDCGHGGSQSGAHGLHDTIEKNITLMFGKKLYTCLTKHGYRAMLTRDGDYDVPLDERTSFANRHHAKLLISIHSNYALNSKSRGIETIYSTDHSRTLAHVVHKQLVNIPAINIVDRGIKSGLLQTTFGCECPAVLVELFFLSNPDDVRLIEDPQVQDATITRLCAAVDQFLMRP